MKTFSLIVLQGLLATSIVTTCPGEWQPKPSRLKSRWADQVQANQTPLPDYPRPQMVREDWLNLNGLWSCSVQPEEVEVPPEAQKFDREILVPFPAESALSGLREVVDDRHSLFYRRAFRLPGKWQGQRILLHFGAVDWKSTVWINGHQVGEHLGGFDPFALDVTDHVRADGENELVVRVWDPTDGHWQPRGKQVRKPGGIWYTPVTGIWQTVWLEPVPQRYIRTLRIQPRYDDARVEIEVETNQGKADVTLEISFAGQLVATGSGSSGEAIRVPLPDFKSWSPDAPHLYDIRIKLQDAARSMDEVASYFGMRKIELKADAAGIQRIHLNDVPTFQYGVLDQGWWPTGLFTAPTDDALRYDIEVVKECGFNMIRKHVKVEPARWYTWCDKLGVLVWQDMPNGDRHIGPQQPDITRSVASQKNYDREWKSIMDATSHFPSVVVWVPFNEGWGQSDTERVIAWTKKYDPTRLVDGPSGWADRRVGHMHDRHQYPGPGMNPVETNRASVLGEFGGLGLPVSDHLWQTENNWGYRTHRTTEQLKSHYQRLVGNLRPLIADGLSAAVYTQITDVESEVNGLLTYDRDVLKLDAGWLTKLHKPLYGPPPMIRRIANSSQADGQAWKFRLNKPSGNWREPSFDDSGWQSGAGGFGTAGTPGSRIGTEWNTSDIWLRRKVDGPEHLADLYLEVHHDEDAEVYLNGVLIAELKGYTTGYEYRPVDRAAIRKVEQTDTSELVLAVHCHQTQGGQYIDVGLCRFIDSAALATD